MSVRSVSDNGNLPSVGGPAFSAPAFDPEEYRDDLAGLKLTEEQEAKILQLLWSIMGHFARMGFAVDVCGLILPEFNEAAGRSADDGRMSYSTNEETPPCGGGKDCAT